METRPEARTANLRNIEPHAQVDVDAHLHAELNVLEDGSKLEFVERGPHRERCVAAVLRGRVNRDLVPALEAVHRRRVVDDVDRRPEVETGARRGLHLEVAAVVRLEEGPEARVDVDARKVSDS